MILDNVVGFRWYDVILIWGRRDNLKVEDLCFFFGFLQIGVKFYTEGNFKPLISNFSLKM